MQDFGFANDYKRIELDKEIDLYSIRERLKRIKLTCIAKEIEKDLITLGLERIITFPNL